ncbi:acyl-homoserine-lactone synthase [Streptomyces sp. NPDC050485]
MFRLRHRVFHGRLHWQVHPRYGRERDLFDDAVRQIGRPHRST